MESDCQDVQQPSFTGDGGRSNQDNIMETLSLISDRMMSSIHDIQHQLVQTDLKFSTALEQMQRKMKNSNGRLEQRYTVLLLLSLPRVTYLVRQLLFWGISLQCYQVQYLRRSHQYKIL
jgi:hypothetical protein